MLLRFSNPQSHQKIYVTHVLHCNSLLKSGAKVLLFGYMGNTLSKKVLRKKVAQGIVCVDSFVIACAHAFNIRCELLPKSPQILTKFLAYMPLLCYLCRNFRTYGKTESS